MEEDGATVMVTENSAIPKDPFQILIENLASNEDVVCKSQQRDEADVTPNEKLSILTEMLNQNKATFLFRFGQFLNRDELKLFEQFRYNPEYGYEIAYHLQHIARVNSTKCIKNRRLAAVKRLSKDDYFSEKEMRKRNPLLYDQLVGLYLSSKEIKIRDMQERSDKTLVDLLIDGMEKQQEDIKRLKQEEDEDAAMEEEDSSSSDEGEPLPGPSNLNNGSIASNYSLHKKEKVSRVFWGEIQNETEPKKIKKPVTDAQLSITAQERKLLKEEFCNTMFENFLDGKDDFDYASIDKNEEYDNLEILQHDEEEKYFDSEEPEDVALQENNDKGSENETSEDELDTYMSALNQHPVVNHLTEAMRRL